MIFNNTDKIYYNSFNFFICDYGYKISYKDTDKGMLYSKIILEKDNKPKIKIEIEKGYLVVFLYIEDNEWSLSSLYKFLHHDKIVKATYGNSKTIKKYFEKFTRKYFDDVMENFDKLKNEEIKAFFTEFPSYVFVWN